MLQSRPLCPALYAISVRRLRTLPAASFRFYLTVDTLAVRLTLPTTKRVVDFHHQAIAHGGRTTKRAARFRRVALKKLLSVFAEQPRAFLGTFISYHILSPKSTQFCPTLSKFVHICPSLSNLRSECYIRRQVAISVRKLSALLKIRFFTLLIVERDAS